MSNWLLTAKLKTLENNLSDVSTTFSGMVEHIKDIESERTRVENLMFDIRGILRRAIVNGEPIQPWDDRIQTWLHNVGMYIDDKKDGTPW